MDGSRTWPLHREKVTYKRPQKLRLRWPSAGLLVPTSEADSIASGEAIDRLRCNVGCVRRAAASIRSCVALSLCFKLSSTRRPCLWSASLSLASPARARPAPAAAPPPPPPPLPPVGTAGGQQISEVLRM